MARLAPSYQETRDSVILHLQSLEKQARAGKVRGFFQIPKFPEDPELCLVQTLSFNFGKVKSANFELFILLTYILAGVQNPWRHQVVLCVLLQATQKCHSPDPRQMDQVCTHQRWC